MQIQKSTKSSEDFFRSCSPEQIETRVGSSEAKNGDILDAAGSVPRRLREPPGRNPLEGTALEETALEGTALERPNADRQSLVPPTQQARPLNDSRQTDVDRCFQGPLNRARRRQKRFSP